MIVASAGACWRTIAHSGRAAGHIGHRKQSVRAMTLACLPALFAGLGTPASGQQRAAFVLTVGNDTVSVERFVRTPERLESELFVPLQNARVTFAADLRPDGTVSRLESSFRAGDARRDAPPTQRAVIRFDGDSAIAEISGAGGAVTQRLHTTAGALPYMNPSFALTELIIARARVLGGGGTRVDVPVFLVQGGTTLPFTVEWQGRDSVVLTAGGVPSRLAVNARSEILGGEVPAQGVRIVRERDLPDVRMTAPARDYSAPKGAPYVAEEVTVPTSGGFTLAGTLTLPSGAARPLPVLVTITGSGLQDRDEAVSVVPGYGLFRQVADTLSRHGIAVLRLDDRGYGRSGGDASHATSEDFAGDIRAAVAYLRSRPDIDASRIGLIGHSEGGIIAPMIAASDASLRGIVLMAAPSWSGRRVIEFQNRYLLERSPGVTAQQRDSLLALSMNTVDSTSLSQPWVRFFLGYDPLPVARKVRVPVLILQGETDRQVTAEQARELAAAMRQAGNRDVEVHVFPQTNHLFLLDASGNPLEYTRLGERTVRSEVLAVLLHWVEAHFR